MGFNIRFKRGSKANLTQLNTGEPAYTTDGNNLYVGNKTTFTNTLIGGKTVTDNITKTANYVNTVTPFLIVTSNATSITSGAEIPFTTVQTNKGFTKTSNSHYTSPTLSGVYTIDLTIQLAPANGTADSINISSPWGGNDIVYLNQNAPTTVRYLKSATIPSATDIYLRINSNSGVNLNTVTNYCTLIMKVYYTNPNDLVLGTD